MLPDAREPEPPWSESRPLNDAAKRIVRDAMAAADAPSRALAVRLTQAKTLSEEIATLKTELNRIKHGYFAKLAEAQPELADRCLCINTEDWTYQTHDHGERKPQSPEWVKDWLANEGKDEGGHA